MSLIPYMQGAEPYFHRGGSIGCLTLHGFTASPAEVRWLGQALAALDLTVYAPRLTGHGTTPNDLARMRWQDWYAATLDGYHILRAQCEHVFVAGLSMGGMLGLLLASEVALDGAVILSTPITFQNWQMANASRLKYLVPYTDQGDKSDFPQRIREEQARRGEPALGRVRYDRWSTGAVGQLYALGQVVYKRLPQVCVPLLLIYSEGDVTVPHTQADIIANRVGTKSLERHTLKQSDHILTQDSEKETVFNLVGDFIVRHA
jgi:carboxylesterase